MTSLIRSHSFIAPLVVGLLLALVALGIIDIAQAQNSNFLRPEDVPPSVSVATNAEGSIRRLIITVIEFALGFMGLIAVIAIIYGGFLYLTSAGDDGAAGKAQTIILYAVIGIIIILLSYAIVNTVLQVATGVPDA